MTREQAMEAFRKLTLRYGLQWRADVPRDAWDQMAAINAILTEEDRREALGIPR
jgi:hypothetical protein